LRTDVTSHFAAHVLGAYVVYAGLHTGEDTYEAFLAALPEGTEGIRLGG